jgi:branched-subunit amino acid ABC-type transport system permease component
MTDLLPFVVVGIATGSVYGLAGMGLVLTYKTSGIFNFAHGAIAAIAAYVYYDLNALRGLPWPVALVGAVVVVPPIIALVMERIARALAGATATMKIVATLGLQLAITSTLTAVYGSGKEFPSFLPTDTVDLLGVRVGIDQLVSTSVGAVGALAFFLFFRFSSMGVRMRAVVDDPDLLSLAGASPFKVRSRAWLIGCHFAAISGVLLAPQLGLDALLLTLLVVQAYGAAAVGLFASLPLTYAGGVLVGVLAALATNFVATSETLSGLPPAMPFLVLFAVLLLAGKRRLVEAGGNRPAPPRPPILGRGAARAVGIAAVLVGVVIPLVVGTKLPVFAEALVFVPIFASLHLLVRTSGQVSLAQAGLVAVGAAAFSHFSSGAPWLVAVLLAGAIAAPVGALVAIPAIRLSGLFLALATFGFGLLLEKVFYRTDLMFGATGSAPAPRPALFGDDTGFYYVLLFFAVAATVLVATIGRSRLGRLLRAMADAPTTLSTLGLGVNVTRVTVFVISAFLAGVGGALYAAQGQTASGTAFNSFLSLTWLSLLVMCSGLGLGAPVAAAIALTVLPAYLDDESLVMWLPVLFGVSAVVVAIRETAAGRRIGTSAAGDLPQGSRAADRLGGNSRAAERAAARARAHPAQPPRIRIGSAARKPAGVR